MKFHFLVPSEHLFIFRYRIMIVMSSCICHFMVWSSKLLWINGFLIFLRQTSISFVWVFSSFIPTVVGPIWTAWTQNRNPISAGYLGDITGLILPPEQVEIEWMSVYNNQIPTTRFPINKRLRLYFKSIFQLIYLH